MPERSQDVPHRGWESGQACLERLCPPSERARRRAVSSEGTRSLADYRAYLSAVERGALEADCPGLRGSLEDRAFEAEGQLRVLLAEGVRSLNDLRDSGLLHAGLTDLARDLEAGPVEVYTRIGDSAKELQETLGLPPTFVGEVLELAGRRKTSLRYDREADAVVVRGLNLANGDPEEMRLRLRPRAGDMGRIGVEQFFGADGGNAVHAGPPASAPGDCHQRVVTQVESPQSIDAYAAILGGLAASRETMYRHARKVSQYGHGAGLRAHDPVVSALVIGGVALTVFIVGTVIAAAEGAASTVGRIAAAITLVAFVALVAISLILLFVLL